MNNTKNLIRFIFVVILLFCTGGLNAQYTQEKAISFIEKVYDRHDKKLHKLLITELHDYMETFPKSAYSADILDFLGKVYEEKGDVHEALASHIKVLFLYPNNKSEWADLVMTIVTDKEMVQNQKSDIFNVAEIKQTDQMIQDRYFKYLVFMINLELRMFNDLILSDCREFIQLFPTDERNDQVLLWIADIYNANGKKYEAEVSYLKFEILYPESTLLPYAMMRKSKLLSNKLKKVGQAMETLDRIVSKFPNCKNAGDALYKLGEIKEKKQKDYKSALTNYRRLVDNYPQNSNVINALFAIAKINKDKQKNYLAAIATYNEIVDRDTTEINETKALKEIASIYKKYLKDLGKTAETYQRIADININYEMAVE